ncbi:Hsp90 co-chaperone cdc37 [Trichuris trichiura]|uniref:Hsp90 co-chaperone cdc37 n=1 Tax=Trichuris trichiura TaxID=36087 RepID=A0A077ZCG7_TRITR|nr:Hsp90 co-chaperone cdc37 [Trichuris trichiura]
MPVDYSKWNGIKLSDDENDGFEIINGSSSFRLPAGHPLNNKALSKEERQKEIQLLRCALEDKVKFEKKLAANSLSDKTRKEYEERLVEANARYNNLLNQGNSLEITKEGTSCNVVKECTRINNEPGMFPSIAPSGKGEIRIQQLFFDTNKELLTTFCRIAKVEDSIRFLQENPRLFNIQTADILVTMALQLCNAGLEAEMKVALIQAMRIYVAIKAAAEMPVSSDISSNRTLMSYVSRFLTIADKHWRDENGCMTSSLERMCEVVRRRSKRLNAAKSENIFSGEMDFASSSQLLHETKRISSAEEFPEKVDDNSAKK